MLTVAQRYAYFEAIGYEPWPLQDPVHRSEALIRLMAGGIRGGKSYGSAMELVAEVLHAKPEDETIFWIVGKEFDDTRREFKYARKVLKSLKMVVDSSTPKRGEWTMMTNNNVLTRTISAGADDSVLASDPVDGILLAEAGKVYDDVFIKCAERVLEKSGWLLLSGTFEKGYSWYARRWKEGQGPNELNLESFSVPTWANLTKFPDGREDKKIGHLERLMANSPGMFQERVAGIPSKGFRLVLPEFDPHHYVDNAWATYDPAWPVWLWIDPGYNSPYAIMVVQPRDFYIAVVDELFKRNLTTNQMISMARAKPWHKNVEAIAMDLAGRQHQAMEAPAELWEEAFNLQVYTQKLSIQDNIQRHRDFLRHRLPNPLDPVEFPKEYMERFGGEDEFGPWVSRLVYNERCTGATTEYANWENQDVDGESDIPSKKGCDAVKAIGYGLIAEYGYSPIANPRPWLDPSFSMPFAEPPSYFETRPLKEVVSDEAFLPFGIGGNRFDAGNRFAKQKMRVVER